MKTQILIWDIRQDFLYNVINTFSHTTTLIIVYNLRYALIHQLCKCNECNHYSNTFRMVYCIPRLWYLSFINLKIQSIWIKGKA